MQLKLSLKFLDMFKSFQAILTINGKSHFLVKDPKVNKAQRRIDELKEEKKEIEEKTMTFQATDYRSEW